MDASAAVYSRTLLSIYDLYVLGYSNPCVWRCPTHQILDFYNEHVSGRHLDMGVGTGYFLDKCTFPVPNPTIALADLNVNSLQATAQRIQRYQPTSHIANVLEPLRIEPAGFNSIALNYLLHCLSGNFLSKGIVFKNLRPLLHAKSGVIFGTTILGKGVQHNILTQTHLKFYNARGIFGNLDDDAADLETVLNANFHTYSLRIVGCVAFFTGRT